PGPLHSGGQEAGRCGWLPGAVDAAALPLQLALAADALVQRERLASARPVPRADPLKVRDAGRRRATVEEEALPVVGAVIGLVRVAMAIELVRERPGDRSQPGDVPAPPSGAAQDLVRGVLGLGAGVPAGYELPVVQVRVPVRAGVRDDVRVDHERRGG